MKIRSFTVSLLASVMLSASLISCAIPPAAPTIAATPTQEATATPTKKATATSTKEATATPDILNLPMNQVAQLLAEGKIEYPANWENPKKAELAIAFAEYLNSITADEAYVPMHFDQVGDIKVGWDPVTKQWHSSHNTPEGSLDFTGDSLPELVVPGYTNAEGQEVIIDPATGAERVIPKINMPGLGEVSITELYAMGPTKLRDYAVDLMLGADGLPDGQWYRDYVQKAQTNRFALPVILNKGVSQNDEIYTILAFGNGPKIDVPEAKKHFFDMPTNEVLMPIFTPHTESVIGWLTIQQGVVFTDTHSFTFTSGENPHWNRRRLRDTTIFGGQANNAFFGILVPGNTTEVSYDNAGGEPLLENGNGTGGIGGGPEILKLLKVTNTPELVQLLMKLRLLVLYPNEIIYQDN